MTAWRSMALAAAVAAVGAVGTLLAGALVGMDASELAHLGALIAPALAATVVAIAVARPLLARASMRQGMAAVAIVGVVLAIANLVVLTRQMVVDEHDATTMAVLLLYASGAGIGAAVALARSRTRAIQRLTEDARRLGEGTLEARVGPLEAGPELDALAHTLDDMASRLEHALERERRVEATRRDLVTAVSHDLRTPLASIRAMVEAIDEGVVEDEASLRRYIHEMRRSVEQLVTMVDDLFELAQLDPAGMEAETRRAHLSEVVASAVDAVALQASDKRLFVVTDLNGAEGSPCSPRLVRVLQNLLTNAVRHTPADGTIRIEARRLPQHLEVAVSDTGQGIASRDLERIFDPFFRADPSRHGAGAGLGLTLARRIVEGLGGQISADAHAANGARFSVVLPA